MRNMLRPSGRIASCRFGGGGARRCDGCRLPLMRAPCGRWQHRVEQDAQSAQQAMSAAEVQSLLQQADSRIAEAYRQSHAYFEALQQAERARQAAVAEAESGRAEVEKLSADLHDAATTRYEQERTLAALTAQVAALKAALLESPSLNTASGAAGERWTQLQLRNAELAAECASLHQQVAQLQEDLTAERDTVKQLSEEMRQMSSASAVDGSTLLPDAVASTTLGGDTLDGADADAVPRAAPALQADPALHLTAPPAADTTQPPSSSTPIPHREPVQRQLFTMPAPASPHSAASTHDDDAAAAANAHDAGRRHSDPLQAASVREPNRVAAEPRQNHDRDRGWQHDGAALLLPRPPPDPTPQLGSGVPARPAPLTMVPIADKPEDDAPGSAHTVATTAAMEPSALAPSSSSPPSPSQQQQPTAPETMEPAMDAAPLRMWWEMPVESTSASSARPPIFVDPDEPASS